MRNRGSGAIIVVIIVVIVLIIGASAASYYILKSQGKAPTVAENYRQITTYTPSPVGTTSVSNNDDVDTLEMELTETTTGDIDADVESLNSSASSL